MQNIGKILSVIAIIVLILGIIFAWWGHGAKTAAVTKELSDLREEKTEYVDRNKESYEKHFDYVDGEHDPENCEGCGPYTQALETYDESIKNLEDAQTASVMDTLNSCLWFVIGCGVLFCMGKLLDSKEAEEA